MQQLPFSVVTNPHMSHVYDLYYKAFDVLRRVREIKSVEENKTYCKLVGEQLKTHLTVIPQLAMGILECQDLMEPKAMDNFMNTLLRSRISRRVIAEHHLAITESFNNSLVPSRSLDDAETTTQNDANSDIVGTIFLRCSAREVLENCGLLAQKLAKEAYGTDFPVPEIILQGHLEATFPYILSHLEYIIGELLRNSIQAVLERFQKRPDCMPPIQVLVCEAPQHVIFRISDQGGGIPSDVMPHLWSFSNKGSRSKTSLENLNRVPRMTATMGELELSGSALSTMRDDKSDGHRNSSKTDKKQAQQEVVSSSLGTLTSRPPNLRLGIGLPMSRVYAEYWAGSLELHSLEGYGADAFLQIPKLGNKNEQLTTRTSMDKV